MRSIEPTADDIRNGWTAEKLTAYHQSRDEALDRQFAGISAYAWGVRPEGMRNRPTRTVSAFNRK